MQLFKTACPLDCWDQCAILAGAEHERIVSIEPNTQQPITGNFLCIKGRKHLERVNHPDRLLYPMLKMNNSWRRVSWHDALEIMAEKINNALIDEGPLSLMHYFDGGYTGLLKQLEGRFFSALGGCTTHKGSLCWAAGVTAQTCDFGAVMAHPYEDLTFSKMIIIWGRNPAFTQVHLLPHIRKARESGAKVVLIDPLHTATAKLADEYIRVNPASDGALALSMAAVIIEEKLADHDFIEKYTSGYEHFFRLCRQYSPERAAVITGVSAEKIRKLARDYACNKPAALLIGIGLQRHTNGGNAVRAIDALAALTGNVGLQGGGANYVNFRAARYIDYSFLSGSDLNPKKRIYPKPKLAKALCELTDPPVRFIYISRGNPLLQVGDSNNLAKAISEIPFVVTTDHFMTDTAAASDLVLPAAMFLEAEDIFISSMGHPYITYGQKAVNPRGECRPEYDFLKELADILRIDSFPNPDPASLLERAIRPLTEATGITIGYLRENSPLLIDRFATIPWEDRQFETEDGKYNFYSSLAEKEGAGGLPEYNPPDELASEKTRARGYKYWLVTPHPRESIHSIHRVDADHDLAVAYINAHTAKREGLTEGDSAVLSSTRGSIKINVSISDQVDEKTIMVYEGWWKNSGKIVNNLTPDHISDLGSQAALYDCLCRLQKV